MTREPILRSHDNSEEERIDAADLGASSGATSDMPQRNIEVEERPISASSGQTSSGNGATLMPEADSGEYRSRWDSVQASFVDEPRKAVQEAEQLLEDVFRALTDRFSAQRSELEAQWDRGGDVSTEDLRLTIQRYRTLFQRLLAA